MSKTFARQGPRYRVEFSKDVWVVWDTDLQRVHQMCFDEEEAKDAAHYLNEWEG